MKAHATPAPQMHEKAPESIQSKTRGTALMDDQRPAAIAQRQLAEIANSNPNKLVQMALAKHIKKSPKMHAQRQQIAQAFGNDHTAATVAQRADAPPAQLQNTASPPNHTGLPNQLKSGVEALSGMPMDHVKVHYNSSQPAQLNALAYAQGSHIHVGPGQEKHLPHEAWHVVQQQQGRVQATMQMAGVAVNNDKGLEHEADVMGARAMQLQLGAQHADSGTMQRVGKGGDKKNHASYLPFNTAKNVQLKTIVVGSGPDKTTVNWDTGKLKGSNEPVGIKMHAENLHKDNVDEGELIGTTPKASAQKNLMAQLPTKPSLSSTNKYIKGHLLNHNVGGPGLDYNMFPITASANSAHHSAIEKTVKEWVLKDKASVDYLVKVTSITDNSNQGAKAGSVSAVFDCQALNKTTGKGLHRLIASQYGTKTKAAEKDFNGNIVATGDYTAAENYNFNEGSWFYALYEEISAEEDSGKVDASIDNFSEKVTAWIENNFKSNDTANKVVQEVCGTKGKRFTKNQRDTVKDVVNEALIVYAWFNDHEAMGDLEKDYPTLIGLLKAPKG